MQNRPLRVGPVALGSAAANILNTTITSVAGPVGVSSPGTLAMYALLTHIRIVNKTTGAVTCSLYIGATGGSAAGTEFAFNGYSIPANSYVDWYGRLRLDPADFLTGLASAATSLTFQAEGELGIV
jgi:hypothetical protein